MITPLSVPFKVKGTSPITVEQIQLIFHNFKKNITNQRYIMICLPLETNFLQNKCMLKGKNRLNRQ